MNNIKQFFKNNTAYIAGGLLGLLAYVGFVNYIPDSGTTTSHIYDFKSKPKPSLDLTEKSIKEFSPTDRQIIKLYGPVTDVSAREIVSAINERQNEKVLFLLINSPGGSVLDGGFILSAMESSKVPIHTVCVQLCASMAAIIHQYGSARLMFDRALLMFHPGSGGARGQIDNMVSQLNTVKRYIDKTDLYIANRVGISYHEFKFETLTELWIDSTDSLFRNFTDQLVYVRSKQVTSIGASDAYMTKPGNVDYQVWVKWKESIGTMTVIE